MKFTTQRWVQRIFPAGGIALRLCLSLVLFGWGWAGEIATNLPFAGQPMPSPSRSTTGRISEALPIPGGLYIRIRPPI